MHLRQAKERNYQSIADASLGLLGEAVGLVERTAQDFVVVGGWSPRLLNDGPIPHPGTRDVDLLFKEGASKGELEQVVRLLRSNGYLSSAKHHFQVLRVLTIKSQPMVFGIDLLHPCDLPDNEVNAEMFVDHVELPIPADRFLSERFMAQSIAAPHAGFVFDTGHYIRLELTIDLPDGRVENITIPVVDEVGLVVTKSSSMHRVKRPRDVFDVYVAIAQARDYDDLIAGFKALKGSDRDVFNTLFGVRKYLDDNADVGRRIERFIEKGSRDPSLARDVDPYASTLRRFLSDVELGDTALPR